MDTNKILIELESIAAMQSVIHAKLLKVCHEAKKELPGDVHPRAARKGAWSDEERAERLQQRMKVLLRR